jgi:hypothetical protein
MTPPGAGQPGQHHLLQPLAEAGQHRVARAMAAADIHHIAEGARNVLEVAGLAIAVVETGEDTRRLEVALHAGEISCATKRGVIELAQQLGLLQGVKPSRMPCSITASGQRT